MTAADYRIRMAKEARERQAIASKLNAMTAEQRIAIEAGFQNMRYLLGKIPRTFNGIYFTDADCASQAAADAYLSRVGLAK